MIKLIVACLLVFVGGFILANLIANNVAEATHSGYGNTVFQQMVIALEHINENLVLQNEILKECK